MVYRDKVALPLSFKYKFTLVRVNHFTTFFNSKNYLTRNKVMLEYLYVNI